MAGGYWISKEAFEKSERYRLSELDLVNLATVVNNIIFDYEQMPDYATALATWKRIQEKLEWNLEAVREEMQYRRDLFEKAKAVREDEEEGAPGGGGEEKQLRFPEV